MSFAAAARTCLTAKSATFSGRARRSEYWWFSLLYVSVSAALIGISLAVNAPQLNVLLLLLIVPMLSVSVRRLHDTGKSGRWMLIGLIPVVGQVVYLAAMTVDSVPGDNQYGPNPKAAGYSIV
jgi:uncharacterized membrane protein YhaH (DUF805 family)